MPKVHKLNQAMTATIARRTVRAGTKVRALFPGVLGSIVLQSLVVHLEREWGYMRKKEKENKPTLSGRPCR